MLIALWVMFLGFERFNNSLKLAMMDFVICFSKNHVLQKKVTRYYWLNTFEVNQQKILLII